MKILAWLVALLFVAADLAGCMSSEQERSTPTGWSAEPMGAGLSSALKADPQAYRITARAERMAGAPSSVLLDAQVDYFDADDQTTRTLMRPRLSFRDDGSVARINLGAMAPGRTVSDGLAMEAWVPLDSNGAYCDVTTAIVRQGVDKYVNLSRVPIAPAPPASTPAAEPLQEQAPLPKPEAP